MGGKLPVQREAAAHQEVVALTRGWEAEAAQQNVMQNNQPVGMKVGGRGWTQEAVA